MSYRLDAAMWREEYIRAKAERDSLERENQRLRQQLRMVRMRLQLLQEDNDAEPTSL